MRITFSKGPCKSFLVPESGRRSDENRDSGSWLTKVTLSPQTPNTFLGVFDRGATVGEAAADAFSKLLKQHKNALAAEDIKALTQVLGTSGVGNNQHVNSTPHPSYRAPVFLLDNAQVVTVNGRTVLEVQGKFVDEKANLLNFFLGIFIASEITPRKIQEIFLQAANEKEFLACQDVYTDCLQSIEW
jgi:hypothetical protein